MSASSTSKDDGLEKLVYPSLLSKVCSELETHLGCGDKILAQFITEAILPPRWNMQENGAAKEDDSDGKTGRNREVGISDDRQRARKLEIEIESETRLRHRERKEGENGYRER